MGTSGARSPRSQNLLADETREILARQVQQIPPECRHTYLSPVRTANIILDAINTLVRTNHSCIYLHGARFEDDEAIDTALQRRQVHGSARLTFEATSKELIIRLMPGREHETTGREFFYIFRHLSQRTLELSEPCSHPC